MTGRGSGLPCLGEAFASSADLLNHAAGSSASGRSCWLRAGALRREVVGGWRCAELTHW